MGSHIFFFYEMIIQFWHLIKVFYTHIFMYACTDGTSTAPLLVGIPVKSSSNLHSQVNIFIYTLYCIHAHPIVPVFSAYSATHLLYNPPTAPLITGVLALSQLQCYFKQGQLMIDHRVVLWSAFPLVGAA